jgi:predicted Rossmann fold flavoprotein
VSADVVIIGAGGAGMMCAIEAGKRGRRVLLLDHAEKLGEKIRISGGGRCNFTNLDARPENFLSANPDFCRSALARYTPRDFIALVERHGIAWHEKKLGQLFCDESAQQIIDMLKAECDNAHVQWCMPAKVTSIEKRERFLIATDRGAFDCQSLVIASGGLSIPQIGASPFGYRIAEQFGLEVTGLRPALVGLTFAPDTLAQFADLSGISVDAVVSCDGASFRENLLVTHRGLSGPAILQISSYWRPGLDLSVNLLPDRDAWEILESAQASERLLANVLGESLPQRFAQRWVEFNFENQPMKRLGATRLREVAERLRDWRIRPSGTVGYKKAEVTLGGVDTRELSSKTLEARKQPGLYFIGEVVDVTGHLGGYNFQWAWASGHAAGQAV